MNISGEKMAMTCSKVADLLCRIFPKLCCPFVPVVNKNPWSFFCGHLLCHPFVNFIFKHERSKNANYMTQQQWPLENAIVIHGVLTILTCPTTVILLLYDSINKIFSSPMNSTLAESSTVCWYTNGKRIEVQMVYFITLLVLENGYIIRLKIT
jgi:hypothetical protein